MPTIQAADIADLVTTSLNELGRLKMTDLMSSYQNTIVLKRLIKKNKMTFDSGPALQFNVIVDTNHSARFVGLAAVDDVNATNVMTTGSIPWRHITWNWMYDRREPIMNSGASKIVDLVKTRRIAGLGDAIIKFETSFWRIPLTTNTTDPYGVQYWIVKSATATTTNDGFNGTTPVDAVGGSYSSGAAGISSSAFSGRWANYATGYSALSKTDLIAKMRRAYVYTDFMPLVDETPVYNLGDDYGIYTNYTVLSALESILESQNENLGSDVAPMDGKVMFRRTPVTFVKELDLDTTNPVYGINWGEFFAAGLRGEWMNETVIPKKADQHTVTVTHTDCSFNYMCRNRRRQWVISNGTTVMA